MLLLSPRVLERLQTFSAVAKSCLLTIDVFFLPLESGKSLWRAEKCFEMLHSDSPSARVFEGIKCGIAGENRPTGAKFPMKIIDL